MYNSDEIHEIAKKIDFLRQELYKLAGKNFAVVTEDMLKLSKELDILLNIWTANSLQKTAC